MSRLSAGHCKLQVHIHKLKAAQAPLPTCQKCSLDFCTFYRDLTAQNWSMKGMHVELLLNNGSHRHEPSLSPDGRVHEAEQRRSTAKELGS